MHLIRAIWLKNDIAVIKRSVDRITLRKTKTDISACFFCRIGKCLKFHIAHNNGGVIIAFPIGAPSFCSLTHTETKVHSNRIARDKKFREND